MSETKLRRRPSKEPSRAVAVNRVSTRRLRANASCSIQAIIAPNAADECDAGHGCLASCDGGCGAVYLGSNGSCTKMCSQKNLVSNSIGSQDIFKPHDLTDAEIRDLLKKDEMKKKISAILCSSDPIDRHGK
jgi:hypothetical protein